MTKSLPTNSPERRAGQTAPAAILVRPDQIQSDVVVVAGPFVVVVMLAAKRETLSVQILFIFKFECRGRSGCCCRLRTNVDDDYYGSGEQWR